MSWTQRGELELDRWGQLNLSGIARHKKYKISIGTDGAIILHPQGDIKSQN